MFCLNFLNFTIYISNISIFKFNLFWIFEFWRFEFLKFKAAWWNSFSSRNKNTKKGRSGLVRLGPVHADSSYLKVRYVFGISVHKIQIEHFRSIRPLYFYFAKKMNCSVHLSTQISIYQNSKFQKWIELEIRNVWNIYCKIKKNQKNHSLKENQNWSNLNRSGQVRSNLVIFESSQLNVRLVLFRNTTQKHMYS